MTPEHEQLVDAARVVEAVAAQRELIARHLHDEAVQTVSVAALRAELVRAATGGGEEIDELRDALRMATLQIRAVMDSLRRPVVTTGELARSLRERLGAAGPVEVIDGSAHHPPEHVALVLCWTAEECVRVLRRRYGDASFSVSLHARDGGFGLDVAASSEDRALEAGEAPDGAVRLVSILGGSIIPDPSSPGTARFSVHVPWNHRPPIA
ncbi:MAG: histidine kinase dimerization/phosphoacceptor domain-containing protein [Solirubrobacteraceae bacterium]|nr:histidine kinase dimerization/phosphoacceptor domain-containing protein [Solirubrobacteraceae bacterium]